MKNNTTLINSILSTYSINAYFKNIALILFGTLLLALSSKVQVPFWPVPMTMQTFIVFIIGMAYGWKLAFSTLVIYLFEGALGLPVFAKGGGLLYLTGPTAGYLYGMTIAAAVIGIFAELGYNNSYFKSLVSLSIATFIIVAKFSSFLSPFPTFPGFIRYFANNFAVSGCFFSNICGSEFEGFIFFENILKM